MDCFSPSQLSIAPNLPHTLLLGAVTVSCIHIAKMQSAMAMTAAPVARKAFVGTTGEQERALITLRSCS